MRAVNDFEDNPQCLALTNQCRRICLQAGADPTLADARDPNFSLVGSALSCGSTVYLEL